MSFPSIPSSSVSGSDAIHTNNTNWETSEGKIRAARSALRFDSSKTQGLGAYWIQRNLGLIRQCHCQLFPEIGHLPSAQSEVSHMPSMIEVNYYKLRGEEGV